MNLTRNTSRLLLLGSGLCILTMAGASIAARGPGQRGETMDNLSSEQRAELHASRTELLAAGASPQEVRETHRELLERWGITCPTPDSTRKARGGAHNELDSSQRAQLHALRQERMAAGDTREEVRNQCQTLLESWGVDPADMPAFGKGQGRRAGRFNPELDDEQRTRLRAQRDQLIEQGASRDEIRAAHRAQLAEWGIEAPAGNRQGNGRKGERGLRGKCGPEGATGKHGGPGFENQLNRDQRAELFAQREALLAAGASREEMRNDCAETLRGWGIELPERPRCAADDESVFQIELPERPGSAADLRHNVHPNPFNPTTVISYQAIANGPVKLSIFDIKGSLVRSYTQQASSGQKLSFAWDGMSEQGASVASGNYLYRIEAGDERIDGRMTLLR